MQALWINLAGLAAIVLTVWWFWLAPKGRKPQTVRVDEDLEIRVKDGVYEPERVHIPEGREAVLRFRREDASPCAEWVLFPDLEVSAQLAVDKITEVTIPATDAGEYPFHCQMQMYRGTLVVE
ncbi:cupredoxin domain-containing protein [Microbulbifer hydrolyticus]|uniref:Cupredoxin domain-containing protein n=1 Tax=Microbulbifer hydrolyticus TaxID=48074 RepID=A0A6P1TG96_9GAMM|nr:cupredoxin domain-containing protein [Microbulbifer hydrolyticus]MBB5212694.1 plastocyanin domain-containing protein [Microbulbifer hydrolyticus]QHQ40289.1 cupredoxin domain-containing protein [Microbulbifer hydrolyticus]